VRAEDDVDPGGLLEDGVLVFLRQAAADRDLHALVTLLHGGQVPEVAIELVVGVLAHGARVDDDDVGLDAVGFDVSRGLERTTQALRVVHVHLAPECAYLIGAGTAVGLVRRDGGADVAWCFKQVTHDVTSLRTSESERWIGGRG